MLQRAKEGTSSLDKQVAAMTTELDFSRAQLATEKVSALFWGGFECVSLLLVLAPPPSHSTPAPAPSSPFALCLSRAPTLFSVPPSLSLSPPASSSPPLPLVALALVY